MPLRASTTRSTQSLGTRRFAGLSASRIASSRLSRFASRSISTRSIYAPPLRRAAERVAALGRERKARRQLRRRWSFSAARRGSRENKSRIISRAVDNARENPYDVLSTSVKGLLKTESTATRPRLSLPCEIRLNGKPTRACYNARSAPFSSSFQGQRHQQFLL